MVSRIISVLVVAIALLAVNGTAMAEDVSVREARAAFDKAQKAYAAKNWKQAVVHFEAAYKARPYSEFLFNIGACYERLRDYDNAVKYYKDYVAKKKLGGKERAALDRRIVVLAKEAARIKSAKPDPSGKTPAPSKEVKNLGKVDTRGVVEIETSPVGASIYVDDPNSEPLSKTPWNGQLEGRHKIIIKMPGYVDVEEWRTFDKRSMHRLFFALEREHYQGTLSIETPGAPGAQVFINDKTVGARGQTPYSKEYDPGRYKVWIVKEGYDEHYEEVQIEPSRTKTMRITLKGGPVGKVSMEGSEAVHTSLFIDGKEVCKRGPCREAIRVGMRKVEVRRDGYKTWSMKTEVRAKTQLTIRSRLKPDPFKWDAVVWWGISGGLAATSWFYVRERQIELRADGDDNWEKWRIGKFAGLGAAGLSGLYALYLTFREKGPPSTAKTDVKLLGIQPQVTPTYAGVGYGTRF